MSARKNPETSIEAYRSLDPDKITAKQELIIKALTALGEATTEECADYLKVPHAQIWKRYKELEDAGRIFKPGNKRPLKSGRGGFTWKLVPPPKPSDQSDSMWKQLPLM